MHLTVRANLRSWSNQKHLLFMAARLHEHRPQHPTEKGPQPPLHPQSRRQPMATQAEE